MVQKYILTIDVEGQGSVTPTSGSEYAKDTVVTLTPTPASGWKFDSWDGPNGSSVVNDAGKYTIAMDSHKNIRAVFIRHIYDVITSVNPASSGQVEITIVDTEHGQTIRATAKAYTGYKFDHWEGDLSGTVNPQDKLITKDTTITAVFTQLPPNTISGIVRGMKSKQPMPGIVIEYYGAKSGQVVTDSNGYFEISDVIVPISVAPKRSSTMAWIEASPTSIQVSQPPRFDADFDISFLELQDIWTGPIDDPLAKPAGIDVHSSGIFVTELNSCKVRKFNQAGVLQATWTAAITQGSTCTNYALDVDSLGNVYVTVNALGANNIQKFNSTGTLLTQYGSWGTESGQYKLSPGIAFNELTSALWVSDSINNRLLRFAADGTPLSTIESFDSPSGMTVDVDGRVYVADRGNRRIVVYDQDGVYERQWSAGVNTYPVDIATDSDGAAYVIDTVGYRIIKYASDGTELQTAGGTGTAVDRFMNPLGIAIDEKNGYLYVTDTDNNRIKKYAIID